MIDFNKKLKEKVVAKPISPFEIYDRLDRSSTAAGPLRPVQQEVLAEWFNNRFNDKDLIVKLHTGQGKTLIGLLMLQSKLNASKGPCLYVCPNIQLAEQVAKDATKFGIPYCFLGQGDRDLPIDFEDGKSILITHVQKVFNGKTIFHLDSNGIKVGAFLLDDSHACIDSIRKSFSIEIRRHDSLYGKFIELFKQSLTEQAVGDYYKIVRSEYEQAVMAVPYWDWIHKCDVVLQDLIEANEENTIFALPLLQNILPHCTMYLTGNKIEITPDYMLTDRFTSFSKADCRILMSATTQDDSFFIKGLGFSIDTVKNPLTSNVSLWSGEKMILFPTLINESITSFHVREAFSKSNANRKYGIVALVPSFWSANEYYRNCKTTNSSDLNDAIRVLESGSCPDTFVFVNRYDGIDLADNKCRILILDSLPVFDSLAERYECNCRHGNLMIDVKIAQKIEQGLGRSVRSETDYSVILIVGEDIIRFIRSSRNQKYFSPQTRCQIQLGDAITEMTKDESVNMPAWSAFVDTLKQCLKRDEGWKNYYKQQMAEMLKEDLPSGFQKVLETILIENEVQQALKSNNIQRVCRQYEKLINKCTDIIDKGWYQQLLAKYTYLSSEVEAEGIQYNAHYNNAYMFMPTNYQYRKLGSINKNRLQMIRDFLAQFESYTDLKLYVDEMVADLTFGMPAEKFEASMMKLGLFLGFESQRPDLEYKKGPDNLWHSANGHFFLIECKDEVKLDRPTISKEESGQMSNHINWFESHYPDANAVSNIWVHPTEKLSDLADINSPIMVITPKKLEILKRNLQKYCGEFNPVDLKAVSDEFIQKLLKQYNFIESTFTNVYATRLKKNA